MGTPPWAPVLPSGEEPQLPRESLWLLQGLGFTSVHKEVTRNINLGMVPIRFHIQGNKNMNKLSLRATILPSWTQKQVTGAAQALCSQAAICKGHGLPKAPSHLGLNSSVSTDPHAGTLPSQHCPDMGQHILSRSQGWGARPQTLALPTQGPGWL